MNLLDIARLRRRQTLRVSSYDTTGCNGDFWTIPAGRTRVLADLRGPGLITHLWMTQMHHYRECLLRFTWDDAPHPSVVCPLGDFFGLGHGFVNSYQSFLFTTSTSQNNQFNQSCALNCYVPMPFRHRAVVELVNESPGEHRQYFYVDYERLDERELDALGYFHTEFRRAFPFRGWAPEIPSNSGPENIPNLGRAAWDHNYTILETQGGGHYLGCNLSVTNFQGTWWGEGDDMIWVDGYKWPPDLHGTGSEDYLNQGWGMQPNAYLRNGSSLHEKNTGGYQTSYVHHLENPVRFTREIKVTIEHGHANQLANEMSSTAYWYADRPTACAPPPPVAQRLPARKRGQRWLADRAHQCPSPPIPLTPAMRRAKRQWATLRYAAEHKTISPWHSPFVTAWRISKLFPARDIRRAPCVALHQRAGWRPLQAANWLPLFVNVHEVFGDRDGIVCAANRFQVEQAGVWTLHLGHDGGARLFVDGRPVAVEPKRVNPAPYTRTTATVRLTRGPHEITVALDTDHGLGWGFHFSFEIPRAARASKQKKVFPVVTEA